MEYQIVSNVADKTALFIEDTMLVAEVRGIIGAMIDCPEGVVMTISYKGKLLKNDDEVWGDVISVVEPKRPSPDAPASTRKLYCNVTNRPKTESVSSEVLRAVIPSKGEILAEEKAQRERAQQMEPMIDAMVRNPQFVDMMLKSVPNLEKMCKDHPEVAQQMRDPDNLKTMIMSQMNPDHRRQMNASMEQQLAQISSIPGGQQMMERYINGFLRDEDNRFQRTATDLNPATEENARPDPNKEANTQALPNPWASPSAPQQGMMAGAGVGASPFASMFGGGGAPGMGFPGLGNFSGDMTNSSMNPYANFMGNWGGGGAAAAAPTQQPLDGNGMPALSPEMIQAATQMMMGMNVGATGGAAIAPQSAPPPPAQTDYSTALQELRDMGFEDEALCLEALKATDGDVGTAVDYIGQKQSNQ